MKSNFLVLLFVPSVLMCLILIGGSLYFFLPSENPSLDTGDLSRCKISQLETQLKESQIYNSQIQKEIKPIVESTQKIATNLVVLEKQVSVTTDQLKIKAKNRATQRQSIQSEIVKNSQHQKSLAEKIDTAKALLQQLIAERDKLKTQVKKENTYSVTNLSGSNGCGSKAPLFAECCSDGLILQPSGTRLTKEIKPQEKTQFLEALKKTGYYVVFLIRPSGIEVFRKYHDLLSKEHMVGFEPINEDWKLLYPPQKNSDYREEEIKASPEKTPGPNDWDDWS